MNSKYFGLSLLFIFIFLAGEIRKGYSQSESNPLKENNTIADVPGEEYMDIWNAAMDNVRLKVNVSPKEYNVFSRFSEKDLDAYRAKYMNRVIGGEINAANVNSYLGELENGITAIYKNFLDIEKRYPSTVENFRDGVNRFASFPPCDTGGCDNINFATGDLTGWYAYYGYNQSLANYNITHVTGGLAGAVTMAANDVLTSTNGFYNVTVGPNPSPDWQVLVTNGGNDYLVPSIPRVSPFGGAHSVMLGDSTLVNSAVAILSQTFYVTTNNDNFYYQYAVLLENPKHTFYEQPFFNVSVVDNNTGDTIPICGEYNVVAGYGTGKWDSILYTPPYNNAGGPFEVYYENWTDVYIPLKKYIGHCVTITFETVDCEPGGHFGYAYVDASCAASGVIASSPAICDKDSLILTAPPGGLHYKWAGPKGGIVGSDSNENVEVVDSGTYCVAITYVLGEQCSDTLCTDVDPKPGPPPHPTFTLPSKACVNQKIHFINTSHPDSAKGGVFHWDFYNSGKYEDSIANPEWSYSSAGTYTIKLEETYRGCITDTLAKITIDSAITAAFTPVPDSACTGSTINFINTSTGTTTFLWNFDDPGSGNKDTTDIADPSHLFANSGKYTVTLVAGKGSPCPDSVKKVITIIPAPDAKITGMDTICYDNSVTLTATGGYTYLWSTGATTSTITVTLTASAVYTVRASTPCGSDSNTFSVYVRPAFTAAATSSPALVCHGDSVTLSASGANSFTWLPPTGIKCSDCADTKARINDTITYKIVGHDGACTDTGKITIDVDPTVTATFTTIKTKCNNPNGGATIKVGGGVPPFAYSWLPGNATTTTVTGLSSGKYTVTVTDSTGCNTTETVDVGAIPLPVIKVTPSSTYLCPGQSVTLTATGGVSYVWNPAGDLSCSNCPVTICTPVVNDSYTVSGTDTNGCTTTAEASVDFYPPVAFTPFPVQPICEGSSVLLAVNGPSGYYTWQPGDQFGRSITVSPTTTTVYTVTMESGCDTLPDTVTVFVEPLPTPQFIAYPTSGCSPLCVYFRNTSESAVVSWNWKFGNGDSSNKENPLYCYPSSGVFSVSLTTATSEGCSATLTIPAMITVYSHPISAFSQTPEPATILDPAIQFIDESSDARGIIYWQWIFGDNGDTVESTLQSPSHTYTDTGTYCPKLITTNFYGCTDTVTHCFVVNPDFTLYIPSAFTPDQYYGLNTTFFPKGTYIRDFDMYVYDRWGMELYHTTDINKGWNGTVNGGSKICQEDTYVYIIKVTDTFGSEHRYMGKVTLLR